MRRLLTMLITAALPILSAACSPMASVETESVCAVWRPITWSSKDTPETIDGVKGSNARRGGWCIGKTAR